MPSDAELRVRRPLWVAMSTLWLDTELQDRDLDHIARALRDSGHDRATLERILVEEVAPVVYLNLYVAAGNWTGFDPDWLCAEILSGLRRRGRVRTWLLRRFRAVTAGPVCAAWDAVLRRRDALAKQEAGAEEDAGPP